MTEVGKGADGKTVEKRFFLVERERAWQKPVFFVSSRFETRTDSVAAVAHRWRAPVRAASSPLAPPRRSCPAVRDRTHCCSVPGIHQHLRFARRPDADVRSLQAMALYASDVFTKSFNQGK